MRGPQICVLVVEDEPLVRIAIVSEMEGDGMQVLEAGNASDALAILSTQPAVDVIFTDIDLPGGPDGLKLARIVADRYPRIRILLTSGHSHDGLAGMTVARFLPKPYVPDRVIRAIHETVS